MNNVNTEKNVSLNQNFFPLMSSCYQLYLPGGSEGKASVWNAGDPGSIPGSGRSRKEMATHSSTLGWKIPWREKPDWLQSMGSQRVGHDWVIPLFTFFTCNRDSA